MNDSAEQNPADGRVPASGSGNGRPLYARPISPSVIRQILREELGAVADSTIDREESVGKSAWKGDNDVTVKQNETGVKIVEPTRGPSGNPEVQIQEMGQAGGKHMSEEEKQKLRETILAANSWINPEDLEQIVHIQEESKKGIDVEREPATLEDAVLNSCHLFFGGFSRRSAIRQQCFEIKKSLWWQSFFLVIIVTNSLYIILAPEFKQQHLEPGQDLKSTRSPGEFWFDLICAAIMGFEVFIGIIAYGFVNSETTYLRNSSFHKLDFACFVFTLLEYFGEYFGMPTVTMRPFRMLRVFKPICKVKSFQGVKSIIIALGEGAPQFGTIVLFLMLTVCAWIILGMAIFSKSYRHRCVTMSAQVPLCASDQSTGNFGKTCNFTSDVNRTAASPSTNVMSTAGYPFEEWCKIVGLEAQYDYVNRQWIPPDPSDKKRTELFLQYKEDVKLYEPGYYSKTGRKTIDAFWAYPQDQYGRWHTCQRAPWLELNATVVSMCEVVGNPASGYSHFDNFWGSLLSISQVIMPDSYYDIIWRSFQSEPAAVGGTVVFFLFVNVFDTFLLLGLFVAVVTGTFKRVREAHDGQSAMITEDQQDELVAEAVRKNEDDISGEEAMQAAALDLVKAQEFITFISLVIVTHVAAMAVDTYDAEKSMSEFARIANLVCTIVFMLEVTLNYMAAGSFRNFWNKLFHRFEVFLIFMGLLGLITNNEMLRRIPAIRTYRLMKYFPTLAHLLLSAVSSVQAIANVMVFIMLVMLCFVVAARYMFGTRVDDISRSNFGSFTLSSLTMFQLITGDSWSGIMYSSMMAFSSSPGDEDDTSETDMGKIYFAQFFGASLTMTWFLFASLIASNLFVAVIIENFQIKDTIDNISRPGKIAAIRSMIKQAYSGLFKRTSGVLSGNMTIDVNTGLTHPVQATRHHLLNLQGGARSLYTYEEMMAGQDQGDQMKNEIPKSKSQIAPIVEAVSMAVPYKKEEEEEEDPERVLFCLMPNNPIRVAFVWLARQPLFDTSIYIAILVSCFFLIIERPYDDLVDYPGQKETLKPLIPSITKDTMTSVNALMTFMFTVEFFCRVMAQGLIMTRQAYLKSGWNIVDTIVLAFAWFEELSDGPNAKVLRMGRALKPLRLMKRNENMRVIIDALINTLQPIYYVILFLVFTLVVFSLIAMGLFGGKLHTCTNPAVVYPFGKTECSNFFVRDDGVVLPSEWEKPYHFDFDDYSSSLEALLQVSTFKYVSIMYACMDVTEVNMAPQQNRSTVSSLFFVVYLFFGGLFVMNLFVGFIIDGFNANKGSSSEDMIYGRFRRQLKSSIPKYDTFKPPNNKYSRTCRRFLESPLFQTFSTLCVMTSVCILLSENANAVRGSDYDILLETLNTAFFGELCFEVGVMAIAYGVGGFYNDVWRGFDVVVCLGHAIGMTANSPMITRFAQLFRLARVLRLASRIKSVRVIIETFIHTVPQLTNIMLLIFLFYSIFAVLGVSFFATTRNGQRLGPTSNFRNYSQAFLAIWQIVTGDEWQILMKDLAVLPPFCDMLFTKDAVPGYQGEDRTWGDCGQAFAPAYVIMMKLVCEYMLLNLYVGLILDNFSYITEDVGQQEDVLWTTGPSQEQLQALCDVFKLFDRSTGHIPISSLHGLLCDLPQPLGYRQQNGKLRIKSRDLAAELLVRAELNLGMRHAREMRILKNNHWTRRLGLRKKVNETLFINAVQYETLFVTLLHWRLPENPTANPEPSGAGKWSLPPMIRWQRQERVEETALVAHALTITDFFRMLVGRRKRKKIAEMLARRSRFMHWSENDPHRKRRNVHTLVQRTEQKDIALEMQLPMLMLLNEPADTNLIVCDWLLAEDVPTDLLDHNKATRDYQTVRLPQPITGIEVFRQKVLTHYIVMQMTDPNNKDPVGDLLVVDLSRVPWRGWDPVNTKHESYYQPKTWAGVDEQTSKPAPKIGWDRVDLYVKSKIEGKAGQRRLGSIEDLQSFVVDDPHSIAKRAADRARSQLRVNLGNHQYTSDKLHMHARVWNKSRSKASRGLGNTLPHAFIHVLNLPCAPFLCHKLISPPSSQSPFFARIHFGLQSCSLLNMSIL